MQGFTGCLSPLRLASSLGGQLHHVDVRPRLAPRASSPTGTSAAVRVSPLCLGAMNFGDAYKERMGECTKETAFEYLIIFFSQGGNFIDTSNREWMATRKNRDQIGLIPSNGSKSMRLSLEESLRRLQTSYVDVFYLHWCDYPTSIEELMHSLNDLVLSGNVLHLGIFDTPARVVARANQYARSNGLRQFSVYQGIGTIIPMCRAEGMGICPYGVLNQGQFQTEDGCRKSVASHQHDKDVFRIINVALAYVFPIVGGRTLEHIKGNIAGLSLALTKKDIEHIESAYRFDPGSAHVSQRQSSEGS
ncbi:NADP-dependent oxidoreductase domain-containing protein [Lipomyces kononenkoae]|uniref:NADP-dependent oxidoreductase domain-containing protein n=1 Tax=Lipomyces kononenkoae TaxID=34357 RepID=A0ACC3STX6_LIPKO